MARTLVIISRIILYYSIFYVVIKGIAIVRDDIRIPHLILAIPFLVLALTGWQLEKRKKYSWIYAIAGIIIISVIRYYESEWILLMHRQWFA